MKVQRSYIVHKPSSRSNRLQMSVLAMDESVVTVRSGDCRLEPTCHQ